MPRFVNKRYPINDVMAGMELGNAILTESGKVALGEGTLLTQQMIERLIDWGFASLIIRERVNEVSEDALPILDVHQQKFYAEYDNTISVVRKAFDCMRYFQEVPINEMRELADKSIESLVESVGVINHLHMVQRQDDYTFHHSVNVAVICGVLGRWLGYAGTDLMDLILTGLMHDIGKTQIPLEILNKPERLLPDEMEVMKQHTTYGYSMVKETKDVPSCVACGILQHHERMDGTGYPLKVKSGKIHPYAKIVAVADIYDAMTSDRVYHSKVTPFAVVETLVEEMFNKLDPGICTVFLNNVRDFLVGSIVQLNDGREAEVLHLGQFAGARPIIRTANEEFIDLEKRKDICIVNLL